nr:hypothetical protein [Tanacetum cinerariifolium]
MFHNSILVVMIAGLLMMLTNIEEEQVVKAQTWKLRVCYDDDDDDEGYNSLEDNIISELPLYSAVTPSEPIDYLSEGENGCDVLACFTTFSNVLFDDDYDFDSSDDQSLSNEDVQEKINSNPLFDEEIIPMEIEQHSFNADDSHMEETDLPFTSDDPMPPGIEDDDYDSGRDIPILEELLDNYSLSLPANESYHFDIPSPYRPPAKPPDGNTGTLNVKMMGYVSDQKIPIPGLMSTRVLNQEKSLDLLSHLGFEAFQPSAECPMIINGKNTTLLDVPLFYFYPLDQLKYGGIRSSSAT